jgi:hypothetical protein
MSWGRVAFGLLAPALFGLSVAGCDTTGQPMAPFAGAPAGTVAFQRIDGLPEPQFRRLVQKLSDEASTRRIAVVSREGPAQYRVRGYAAAQIRGKHTVIAWVWDVYDANQQRVTRLGGEEEANNHQRGWGAADDQVLRRIAHEGMDQLASFLVAPPDRVPAPPALPAPPGPAPTTGTVMAATAAPAGNMAALALAH